MAIKTELFIKSLHQFLQQLGRLGDKKLDIFTSTEIFIYLPAGVDWKDGGDMVTVTTRSLQDFRRKNFQRVMKETKSMQQKRQTIKGY